VRHHLVALIEQLLAEPDLLSRLDVEQVREHRGTEGAGAQVMKFFGLDVDIDDGAELSKALRDAQERLAQASRLAAVAELSASIAHELNQPLQAIVAHGHACVRWLAATPPRLDKARYSAEQVVHDANAAADVVSRIRALFRHTAPQKVDLDINKLILQVCTLMADDIQRNAVSLETILCEDVSKISADAVQIQQVIVNLVRNAIEALAATEQRPRLLVIRSRRDEDNVVIDVEDHGTGHVDFEKIFEPFFTTKETGMGMGLAICRSIIEAHAGRIWAVRNVSRGVTFSFSLPIERSNATAR
jgi:C4-dicarboxylate-specific signal transduction histidine kinase